VLLDGCVDRTGNEQLHRIAAAMRYARALLVDHQDDVPAMLATVELGLGHGVSLPTNADTPLIPSHDAS
jgi:hypothetical protein